jgi:hypothetical protein
MIERLKEITFAFFDNQAAGTPVKFRGCPRNRKRLSDGFSRSNLNA